ncbi:mavicyanin-like [Nicotiana tabacum]|uniref:Mavicyanin-like n=1 Tax=Nicotiana tabacum TaxID=4097 RepID=A0A1S4BMI4_TOBAC|nr:mavicyanin-like [Nicotiana tomentosiformis]XP_016490060.1 PREDICTED: mavicyanin-like [Nicotiana tabacum]
MALFRKAMMFLLVVIMTIAGSTMAEVYEVGDFAGWDFNVDYNQWVSSKKFKLGDSLVFNYNPRLHNVMQVDSNDYNACTDNHPIVIYNTGGDTLTLETPGDYFFLCGFPGHCASGLKFHIKISTPHNSTPPATSNFTPPAATNGDPWLPGFPAFKPKSSAYSSKWSPMSMLMPLLLCFYAWRRSSSS